MLEKFWLTIWHWIYEFLSQFRTVLIVLDKIWLISLRVILSVSVLEVVITSSVFQKWQKNVVFLSNEPVSSDYNFALCSFRTYVWLWLWPSNITLVRSWHLPFHSPPACEASHINMYSFHDCHPILLLAIIALLLPLTKHFWSGFRFRFF